MNEQETRRKALTRFALDFLKANLEALEDDGLLESFVPNRPKRKSTPSRNTKSYR